MFNFQAWLEKNAIIFRAFYFHANETSIHVKPVRGRTGIPVPLPVCLPVSASPPPSSACRRPSERRPTCGLPPASAWLCSKAFPARLCRRQERGLKRPADTGRGVRPSGSEPPPPPQLQGQLPARTTGNYAPAAATPAGAEWHGAGAALGGELQAKPERIRSFSNNQESYRLELLMLKINRCGFASQRFPRPGL